MRSNDSQAILLGLALGDAIGSPVEFMGISAINQRYGPGGISEPPDPALYTDDTQMTTALVEGVLSTGLDASVDDIATAIGRQFVIWMHTAPNRSPGATCIAGVTNFERGASWYDAGIKDSKGCGSAMRVAPLGYLYQDDDARLAEVARASGLITHGHPAAVAASVAAAYVIKLALDGEPVTRYLQTIMHFCDGISDEFDAAMLRVGHVLGWVDEVAAMRHIGEGWVGEEAVALALYCVLRYPDDYVACMRRAANSSGDSDSIACIAGGIMGARLGIEAIPAAWIERCENRDYLLDLGLRIAQARSEAMN